MISSSPDVWADLNFYSLCAINSEAPVNVLLHFEVLYVSRSDHFPPSGNNLLDYTEKEAD
jgi:hypothetical protein